jgi:hypothetical protein
MDFSDDSGDEYNPFSDSDYDMWDKIKAALPPASSPPPPDKPREHPSNNPTCGGNQASGLPSKVTTDKGDVAPKELQYWMREGTTTTFSNDAHTNVIQFYATTSVRNLPGSMPIQ